MSFLTVDFETAYGDDLGFKTQTNEEYLRDPRFEVIGVSVKVDTDPAVWFSGTKEETQQFLDQFDWKNSALLCHNMLFDGAILSWHFGIIPAYYYDTLCMARAVHGVDAGGSLAKLVVQYGVGIKGTEVVNAYNKFRKDFSPEQLAAYGAYCINDTETTFKLFGKMISTFPEAECDLIDITLRMYTQPIFQVDDALLLQRLETIQQEKSAMLQSLMKTLDVYTEEEVRAQLASNAKFAKVITGMGIEVPMKISAKTGKQAPALAKNDIGFLELQEHEDPVVQQLCAVRLGTKSTMEESRINRFIGIGSRNYGKLPIPLKYYGAHTGRWAGCLVDDTRVTVYNPTTGMEQKRIVDVLLDDLVWDGEEFVAHSGVQFSGYAKVIEWDGVRGTEDHVVYTDGGAVSLREAMQGSHPITAARSPTQDDVDTARKHISADEG